jgi:hypothetical protein
VQRRCESPATRLGALPGALFGFAALAGCVSPVEPAPPLPLVVLGDSYSDEWLPPGFPDPFEGFSELLRAAGRIDLGPTELYFWPDPRVVCLLGWQSRNNFAEKGAEGWQVLEDQSPTAVELMRDESIDFASVLAGGGEMLHGLALFSAGSGPEQTAVLDAIAVTLGKIADAVASAQPGVSTAVLVTYPDFAHSPFVRAVLGDPGDVVLDRVAAHVTALDDRIRALAQSRQLPLVDLWQLVDQVKQGGVSVHGIPLEPDPYFVPEDLEGLQAEILEAAAEDAAENGGNVTELPDVRRLASVELTSLRGVFTVDGIHLPPILHALWSNRVLDALRASAPDPSAIPPPLTPKEMVTLTGLDPQRPPTADAGPGYTIPSGASLTLDASASGDPNPGDVPGLAFAWDVDGDGQYDDALGEQPTLAWSVLQALGIDVGEHALRVRVDDGFGGVTESAPTRLRVVP